MQALHSGAFKNDFTNSFEGDESGDLSPRQTPGVLYSKAIPTPVPAPYLIGWSNDLAQELGIKEPTERDIDILAGNHITPSMQPYAACYAGHQFGNWAGQLGDGRAITLGEWETVTGPWELQLKGAGPTAYSRRADGRAVLRSSVREYLMSEAMHYLNIPTTRALSLVGTGEKILRDVFYNGNPAYEPGAIVLRTSPSFLRFGNFEMLASRNEIPALKKLTHWTIDRFFPEIPGQGEERIINWFREVVERTATLMTAWQRVGFVHGVMNTDNMSILGKTIDYGPFSFLDDYDPNFTPNTTDLPGRRYAFKNQPSIGYWNLGRLASALSPLIETIEPLQQALDHYEEVFWNKYYRMMGDKLGLDTVEDNDRDLIAQFEKTLSRIKPDMTMFYRLLSELPATELDDTQIHEYFQETFYEEPDASGNREFINLLNAYRERLKQNKTTLAQARDKMKKANPKFILRNYLLHQAIEELEKGNDTLFKKLQKAIQDPYKDNATEFFNKRPAWAMKKAGCSMLSCSS